VATSYYADRPEKSMALISEPGGSQDGGRWVKEGTQIGHFTVQQIKQGLVVLRDGDNVRELAVERTAIQRNLVREVRPGNPQVARLDLRPVRGAVQDSNIVPSTGLSQAPSVVEGNDVQDQVMDVGL
jgi:hypothetical protein